MLVPFALFSAPIITAVCIVLLAVAVSSKGVSRRRTPGSGLRHYALSVLTKVEAKGETTYSEVADELVKEVPFDSNRARPPPVSIGCVCYNI